MLFGVNPDDLLFHLLESLQLLLGQSALPWPRHVVNDGETKFLMSCRRKVLNLCKCVRVRCECILKMRLE